MLMLVLMSVAAALQSTEGTSETPKSLSDIETIKESVQTEIVSLHNALRRGVKTHASNMLKMEWNEEAAKSAEYSAKRCIFQHVSEDKRNISMWDCGENLFMASYPATWKEAIQRWYDEQEKFIYGKGPVHKDDITGHFTQIVWAKTFLVGCAVAFCEHFYIYVCHYCPEGNDEETINEPYKAGDPCADCKEHCLQGLCNNPCTHRDQATYCESVQEQELCWMPKFRKGCMATCDCEGKI